MSWPATSDNGASASGQAGLGWSQSREPGQRPAGGARFFSARARGAASLDVNRGTGRGSRRVSPRRKSLDHRAPNRCARRSRARLSRFSSARATRLVAGQDVIIMNAMKMEHVLQSEIGGIVQEITVSVGDIIWEGHPLVFIELADVGPALDDGSGDIDLDYIRPDLQHNIDLHEALLDHNRPEPVAKASRQGQAHRAREHRPARRRRHLDRVHAAGASPAQRRNRSWEELRRVSSRRRPDLRAGAPSTPISSTTTSPAPRFISYDETVWAGDPGWPRPREDGPNGLRPRIGC